MERFTRGQLQLVNNMKKTLGQDIIWKFFEYLRVEDEIGHSPSIAELVANAGDTTEGSWCMAVGGLKEAGFIQKKTRMQTVEEVLWESNFMDLLWQCVNPYTGEYGFETIDSKNRAQSAVHTLCDTKAKAAPERADIIHKCEDKIMENIQQIWDGQFAQNVGTDGLPF